MGEAITTDPRSAMRRCTMKISGTAVATTFAPAGSDARTGVMTKTNSRWEKEKHTINPTSRLASEKTIRFRSSSRRASTVVRSKGKSSGWLGEGLFGAGASLGTSDPKV